MIKKRLQIARLNRKIKALLDAGAFLCDPAVVELSQKMDKLIVAIMGEEKHV